MIAIRPPGKTQDGAPVLRPDAVMSTAEAVNVAHAAAMDALYFGDGKVTAARTHNAAFAPARAARLTRHNWSFRAGWMPSRSFSRPRCLFERLRRAVTSAHGEPSHLALRSGSTDTLLDHAWNALLRQGERGRMAAPEIFSGEAADLSRRLRQAGFLALANVFSPVGLHTSEAMAAFCLRAAYAVRTTRSARARLAWMR